MSVIIGSAVIEHDRQSICFRGAAAHLLKNLKSCNLRSKGYGSGVIYIEKGDSYRCVSRCHLGTCVVRILCGRSFVWNLGVSKTCVFDIMIANNNSFWADSEATYPMTLDSGGYLYGILAGRKIRLIDVPFIHFTLIQKK